MWTLLLPLMKHGNRLSWEAKDSHHWWLLQTGEIKISWELFSWGCSSIMREGKWTRGHLKVLFSTALFSVISSCSCSVSRGLWLMWRDFLHPKKKKKAHKSSSTLRAMLLLCSKSKILFCLKPVKKYFLISFGQLIIFWLMHNMVCIMYCANIIKFALHLSLYF